ncbi:MAG: beta-ketoacyl synthase N-terminal-like domain-containing protein, partial [bacterium]
MAAERLIIRGLSTISPLGSSRKEVSQTLTLGRAKAQWLNAAEQTRPVFPLAASGMNLVEELSSQARYQGLDRTTLLALTAARQTFAALRGERMELGCISIGSARGATNSLERSIALHLAKEGTLAADTSPTTTAGNTTSWIAQEYLAQEDLRAPKSAHSNTIASISTSMTCTSAFHALLIATAFLRGGMASAALFGGAESCLTSYTVAQLEALRIYSRERSEWPCRPCASSEHS